jgi:hypothetical protein
MYPGLNALDCRVAELRYHQMVAEGQRQQFIAGIRQAPADFRPASTTIRRQLGTLLMRTCQYLLGAHAVTRDNLGSVAAGERAAIA